MKYAKYLVLILSVVLCFGLVACAEDPGRQSDEVIPTTEMLALDGTWESEDGRRIMLMSENNRYWFQTSSGRVGSGVYLPVDGEPVVKFDGTSYLMTVEGETLKFKTQGTPGSESLDGVVFSRCDARVLAVSRSKLQGTWSNGSGNFLSLDFDGMNYEFRYSDQSVTGKIADDDNGKGIYLSVDGEPVYFSVAKGSVSFQLEGATPFAILQGVYTKDEASDLSAYSDWMDTWFYMGDPAGRRLILFGTGSWESYDESGNKDGSGRLKTDESYKGLGLINESGNTVGIVSLGAEGQLFWKNTSDDAPMEYYLRQSLSE